MRGAVLIILLTACGRDGGGDPATRVLLERAQADLPLAEAAAARGDDPATPCSTVLAAVDNLREARALDNARRDAWERACRHDLPLQYARALVARLETKLDGGAADACIDLSRALSRIVQAEADPDLVALHAKLAKLCP